MPSDLIYREDAKEYARHAVAKGLNVLEYLDEVPAADFRPVVRGEWINDHNGKYSASGDNFYCSICKDPCLRAFGEPAKTNYCPNCGADMREVTE